MAGEITVIPWADISPATTIAGNAEVIIKEGSTFSRITKDNFLAGVSTPAIAGNIDFSITEQVDEVTGPTMNPSMGPQYVDLTGTTPYIATFDNGFVTSPAQNVGSVGAPDWRALSVSKLDNAPGANGKAFFNCLPGTAPVGQQAGAYYYGIATPDGTVLSVNILFIVSGTSLIALNHLTNGMSVLDTTYDVTKPFRVYFDVAANTIQVEVVKEGVSSYFNVTPTSPLTATSTALMSTNIQFNSGTGSAGVDVRGFSGANNFGETFTTLPDYIAISSTTSTTTLVYPAIPLNTAEDKFYTTTVTGLLGGGYINPGNAEVVIGDGDIIALTKNGSDQYVVSNITPNRSGFSVSLRPEKLNLSAVTVNNPNVGPAAILTLIADQPGWVGMPGYTSELVTPRELRLVEPNGGLGLASLGDTLLANTKSHFFFQVPMLYVNGDPVNYPTGIQQVVGMAIANWTESFDQLQTAAMLIWSEGEGLTINSPGMTPVVVDALAAFDTTHLIHVDVALNKIVVKNVNGVFEVTPPRPLAVGMRPYALISVSVEPGTPVNSSMASVEMSTVDFNTTGLTPEAGFVPHTLTINNPVVIPPSLPADRQPGFLYEVGVGGVWTNTDGVKVRFLVGDIAIIKEVVDDVENISKRSVSTTSTVSATFDPNEKTTAIVLSNGNLTATHASSGFVIGTLASTNNNQFEMGITHAGATAFGFGTDDLVVGGVGDITGSYTAMLIHSGGNYNVVIGPIIGSGTIYPATNAGSLSLTSGSTVGATFNTNTRQLVFYVNGVEVVTATTLYMPGGLAVKPLYYGLGAGAATVNMGATPFTYPESGFVGFSGQVTQYTGYLRVISDTWNPSEGYPTTPTPVAGDLHYAGNTGTIGTTEFVAGMGVWFDGTQWRKLTEAIGGIGSLTFLGEYPSSVPQAGFATTLPTYVENGVYRLKVPVRYKENATQTLYNYFHEGSTIIGRNGQWEYLTVNAIGYGVGAVWPIINGVNEYPYLTEQTPALPMRASFSDDKVIGIFEYRVKDPTPSSVGRQVIFGLQDIRHNNNVFSSPFGIFIEADTGAVKHRTNGEAFTDNTTAANTPKVALVAGDVISFVFSTYGNEPLGPQELTVYKNGFIIAESIYTPYLIYPEGPLWAPFGFEWIDIVGVATWPLYYKVALNTGKVPFHYYPHVYYSSTKEDLAKWAIPLEMKETSRIRIHQVAMSLTEAQATFNGGVAEESFGGVYSGADVGQRAQVVGFWNDSLASNTFARKANPSASLGISVEPIRNGAQPAMARSAMGIAIDFGTSGVSTRHSNRLNRKSVIYNLDGTLLNGGNDNINTGSDAFGADGNYAIAPNTGKTIGPKLHGSWLTPFRITGSPYGQYVTNNGLRYTKPADTDYSGTVQSRVDGLYTPYGSIVRPDKHTVLVRMKSLLHVNPLAPNETSPVWMLSFGPGGNVFMKRYADRLDISFSSDISGPVEHTTALTWTTGTDEVWGFAFDEVNNTLIVVKPDTTTFPAVAIPSFGYTTLNVNSSSYESGWEFTIEDISNPALSGFIQSGYGFKMTSAESPTIPGTDLGVGVVGCEFFVDNNGDLRWGKWSEVDFTDGTGSSVLYAGYGQDRHFAIKHRTWDSSFNVIDDLGYEFAIGLVPAGAYPNVDFAVGYFDAWRSTAAIVPVDLAPLWRGITYRLFNDGSSSHFRNWKWPDLPYWAKPGTMIEASTDGRLHGRNFDINTGDIILVGANNGLTHLKKTDGNALDTTLREWARSKAYTMQTANYDAGNGNRLVGAVIMWPDGVSGMYEVLEWDVTTPTLPTVWRFIYYGTPYRLIQQPAVTYNAAGLPTATPVLYIGPVV